MAKCLSCGNVNAYIGLSVVECPNKSCRNFKCLETSKVSNLFYETKESKIDFDARKKLIIRYNPWGYFDSPSGQFRISKVFFKNYNTGKEENTSNNALSQNTSTSK